jgi:hypothetical protein
VFWVTENQKRAHAAERLQDRGAIIRDGGAFPWCAYEVPNVLAQGRPETEGRREPRSAASRASPGAAG